VAIPENEDRSGATRFRSADRTQNQGEHNMKLALYIVAGFLVFAGLAVVGLIGKERKPITSGQAVFIVVIQFSMAIVVALGAHQIS
jgi:hypothetical protein